MKKTVFLTLLTYWSLTLGSCQLFPQLFNLCQDGDKPTVPATCNLLGKWDVPYYLLQNAQTGETKRVQYGEPTAFFADGTYKQPFGGIGKYEIKDCILRQDYEGRSHYYKIGLNTDSESVYSGPYNQNFQLIGNELYTFFLFKNKNI